MSMQKKIEELQISFKQVKQIKETNETISQSKADIIASIRHELKTPLHGILGFAEIGMKQSQHVDREKLQEYFAEINSNGQKLLDLLDNLLDSSKSENKKNYLQVK